MQHGYQCGQIWGAALAAGARSHQLFGSGPKAETGAILASRAVLDTFKAQSGHIDCVEITDLDNTATTMQMMVYFLVKGGAIGCFKRAAVYAPVAYDAINKTLLEIPERTPATPVSCTAMLAEKIGATQQQVVMAAGFAGGIGLCGGACGALGAAIWLLAMKRMEQKIDYKDPARLQLIGRFAKHTNYEFTCETITGKHFDTVADHAAHLKQGGCRELLDMLVEYAATDDARSDEVGRKSKG